MSGGSLFRRVLNGLGVAIAIAGVFFVVRVLVSQWDDVVDAIRNANVSVLLLAFAFGIAGMTQIGLGWRRALSLVGEPRPIVDTLYRYFVGQLGKYVPGGIWPVLGRSEMARRGGVPGTAAYAGTLLSLGATYLAAILTAVLALPAGLDRSADLGAARLWVVALLPLGLLALHPRALGALRGAGIRVTGRRVDIGIPPWWTSVRLALRHIPAWLSIALATWSVSVALGATGSIWNIVFATALSWVVGFVIVPVPGGIGVREAVFIATATSLPAAVAATVAITARLLFVAVDASGALALSAHAATRTRPGREDSGT